MPIADQHGVYSFYLVDLDHNWWEIQHCEGLFQDDDLFDFGDRFSMDEGTASKEVSDLKLGELSIVLSIRRFVSQSSGQSFEEFAVATTASERPRALTYRKDMPSVTPPRPRTVPRASLCSCGAQGRNNLEYIHAPCDFGNRQRV